MKFPYREHYISYSIPSALHWATIRNLVEVFLLILSLRLQIGIIIVSYSGKSVFSGYSPIFYYLTGGDYNVSDIRVAIIGINASKFKLNKHSQEILGMKLYSRSYKQRKFVVMEVLTCDGDFGKQAPSEKEIKKVEKLISQKLIGDIP